MVSISAPGPAIIVVPDASETKSSSLVRVMVRGTEK